VSDYNYLEEEDFSTTFNGKTLRRIGIELKPFWRWVIGFVVTVALVSFMEAVFTYIGKLLVDSAIAPKDTTALTRILIGYGSLAVFQVVNVFLFIAFAGILGEKIQYSLRRKLFSHLQTLSLSYYDRIPVGWLISRVNSDTEKIGSLVSWGLLDVTWAIMNIITSFVFMLTISWQMALLVMVVLPILLVIAAWFKSRILSEYRVVRKMNSKITGNYNEMITGVRVVKALSRESESLAEFSTLTHDMYSASFKAEWLSALFMPIVQVISAVAVGIVLWYGGGNITVGGMTIGGIQAFIGYITFMMWPVLDLSRVYAEMQQSIASAERCFSLLDSKAEIVDRPNAVDPGTLRGEIVFNHVNFYYKADQPILSDFNLTIKAGETIALVGATGSGKSTIVNLLCRFYEPTGGTITINGRDYTTMTLHGIHSRIGMVLQTPRLFSGTIRENIRYGRLDATNDEIEVAAKMVGAHDFISAFKKGYDEEVGEGGVLLSVGQKQLLSLARAVLAKPELFIMDEATSSVDTLTEALIQRGMENLMKDRTSVIIAHRLSTIKRADRILVIDAGKVIEQGTHAELLRMRGHYYKLYTRQFRHDMAVKHDPTHILREETRQIAVETELA
jgi:ATP-binding cassette, subfamily B, bacterial